MPNEGRIFHRTADPRHPTKLLPKGLLTKVSVKQKTDGHGPSPIENGENTGARQASRDRGTDRRRTPPRPPGRGRPEAGRFAAGGRRKSLPGRGRRSRSWRPRGHPLRHASGRTARLSGSGDGLAASEVGPLACPAPRPATPVSPPERDASAADWTAITVTPLPQWSSVPHKRRPGRFRLVNSAKRSPDASQALCGVSEEHRISSGGSGPSGVEYGYGIDHPQRPRH